MDKIARTKKAAYTPSAAKSLEVSSRDICTQLNNYQKQVGMEPYFGIYRCAHCGHWYVTQQANFYKTPSPLYEKNNGYLTICKFCAQNLFDEHCKELNNDLHKAMKLTCHELDWPYDKDTFDVIINKTRLRGHMVESYASIIDSAKYTIGLSYSETIMKGFVKEQEKFDREDGSAINLSGSNSDGDEALKEEGTGKNRLIAAANFFGKKYNNEQLDFLQSEYDDWTEQYDCQTKAHREIFKNICLIQLKIREGNATKDDVKTLQDLMDSASIKPKQQIESALAEQNTLGMLIRKWEESDPIPEPSPELKDVDGIRQLIDTYFYGHLCNAFHFENEYSEQYEKEIEKYSVYPPTYSDDDLGTDYSGVMFKTPKVAAGGDE